MVIKMINITKLTNNNEIQTEANITYLHIYYFFTIS